MLVAIPVAMPDAATIYLLSPANTAGARAKLLLREQASFALARQLRSGAELGEVFSFLSGLYFRGKLAYARHFHAAPPAAPGALVITAGRGLLPPETPITTAELRAMADVAIEAANQAYRIPLQLDARKLARSIPAATRIVLLGSIATPKYIEPLLEVWGERLLFPAEFVGRGDMSRGGLLLRHTDTGVPLTCIPVQGALRRGTRPPKLPRRSKADSVTFPEL